MFDWRILWRQLGRSVEGAVIVGFLAIIWHTIITTTPDALTTIEALEATIDAYLIAPHSFGLLAVIVLFAHGWTKTKTKPDRSHRLPG